MNKRILVPTLLAIAMQSAFAELTIDITGFGSIESDQPVNAYVDQSYASTKVASRISTTPINSSRSIESLGSKLIEDQGATTMQDAMKNVAGVSANSNLAGNRSNYMLRGYNIDDNNGTKIDGQQTLQWADFDLFNIDRIEVSKGPNASAFGKSDPAGFVNIVTKKADGTKSFEVQQDVGTYGFLKTSVAGNVALADNLWSRTVVSYSTTDAAQLEGNRGAEKQRSFFSQNFVASISDKTKLEFDLRHLYDKQNYGLTSQLPAVGTEPANIDIRTNMSSPNDEFSVDDWTVGYRLKTELADGIEFNHSLKYQTVDRTRRYLNPSSLSSKGMLSAKYYWNESTKTYTSTDNYLSWASDLGGYKNTLVGGFDYVNADSDSKDYSAPSSKKYSINIYNPDFSNFVWHSGPEVKSKSKQSTYGFYLQDQLYVTDSLILSGGIRHDSSTQSSDDALTATDTKNSPNVGVVYKLTPTVSVYADYATSFMPQSQTATGYVPPQTSKQKEVGLKWIDPSREVSFTASLYDLVKSDIATPDPTNPSVNVYTGEARNKGLELEGSIKLSKSVSLLANYARVDSKITEDNVATNVGNAFPSVPRTSFGSWVMYDSNYDGSNYGLGIGFTHMSDRAGDTANTFVLPAYTVVDASAYYYVRKDTRLQLTLKNIGDVDYYAGSNSRYNIMQGNPFTAMLSVNFKM